MGSGSLSPELHGDLGLAGRMHSRVGDECTRNEVCLVLLPQALPIRVSPGTRDVNILSTGFGFGLEYLGRSAPVQAPCHTGFLCPEATPYYQRLGSAVYSF